MNSLLLYIMPSHTNDEEWSSILNQNAQSFVCEHRDGNLQTLTAYALQCWMNRKEFKVVGSRDFVRGIISNQKISTTFQLFFLFFSLHLWIIKQSSKSKIIFFNRFIISFYYFNIVNNECRYENVLKIRIKRNFSKFWKKIVFESLWTF